MTLTQSIILATFAFIAGCVVTYIIKKANEYQRPMLPNRDREFIDQVGLEDTGGQDTPINDYNKNL